MPEDNEMFDEAAAQDAILGEISEEAKGILNAGKSEGGALSAEGVIDELLAKQFASSEKPEEKPEPKAKKDKSDAQGVRFNNLDEAERETRKLQSERDSLQSEINRIKNDPGLMYARQLLEDIGNNPELEAGIKSYYQTGSFGQQQSVGEYDYGVDDSLGLADLDTSSPQKIEEIVERKVNERLKQAEIESGRRAMFEAQRQALLEAYPHIDENEWNDLVEFAKDPKGATLVNLYRLKNINQEVEDRAKVLAERWLRTGGHRVMSPSATSAAGAGREQSDEDPQVQAVRDILMAGRRESLLG